MKLRHDIDFSTLNWVKDELDETLKQARNALDAYAEDTDDASQMRFCATYLHQAQGTLRMVELYGAALLVEEMETVALGLLEGEVRKTEDVFGVLMRALVQLPDYLERLEGGHRDIPVALLPLLNDLRSARGAKLLSENVLFSPDLTSPLPASAAGPKMRIAPATLKPGLARLRGAFELALLRWIKDESSTQALDRIGAVMDRLQRVTHDLAVRRLWWVCGGLVESLLHEGFDSLVSVKLLFGRVDRTLKEFVEKGEGHFADNPPESLTRSVLYYVAQVAPSGERTRELHELYNLAELLPKAEELEHAEGSLSGRNRELLDTVSGAIKEDLLRVKDALDLHLRQETTTHQDLLPLAEELDRVADTLGMLALGVPRKVILDQKVAIEDVAEGRREADEKTLLDVAGALLYVESSLDDHIDSLGHASNPAEAEMDDEPVVGFELPRSEVRRILEALIKEANVNLQNVKNAVVAFIESPWEHDQLTDCPAQLDEITGALRILDLPQPASYVEALSRYFSVELLEKQAVPEEAQLDTLADTVASIEYYLEGVSEQRPQPQSVLDVALTSLRSLGYEPMGDDDAPTQDDVSDIGDSVSEDAATAIENSIEEFSLEQEPLESQLETDVDIPETFALTDGDSLDAPELAEGIEGDFGAAEFHAPEQDLELDETPNLDIELEDVQDDAAVLEDDFSSDQAPLDAEPVEDQEVFVESEAVSDVQLEIDDAVSSELESSDATEEPSSPVEPVPEFVVGEVDDDIREIFVEEFEEELENQREHYPLWRGDQSNAESLAVLRRSFHTLKGSGRLVGAVGVGEFAWKVEDLLNPLLEDEATASPALLAAMDHVIDVMPQMFKTLTEDIQPTTNVPALASVLVRLSDGEEAYLEEATAASSSDSTTDADAADIGLDIDAEAAGDVELALEDELELEDSTDIELQPLDDDDASLAVDFETDADDAQIADLDLEAPDEIDTTDAEEVELEGVDLDLAALDLDDGSLDLEAAALDLEDDDASASEEESSFELEVSSEVGEPEVDEPEETQDELPPSTIDEMEFETDAESDDDTAAVADTPEAVEPLVDPVMLDILRGEVDAHVGVVDAYVAASEAATDEPPASESVMRAVHTLTGATSMVDVPELRELCDPLEAYVKELHLRGEAPNEAGQEALTQATGLLQKTVAGLDEPHEALPETSATIHRLQSLLEALPPRDESVEEPSLSELDAAGALNFELPASDDSSSAVTAEEPTAEIDAAETAEAEVTPTPAEQVEDDAEPEPEPEAQSEAEAPEEVEAQHSEIDEELLEIFVQEAEEILDEAERFMSQLRDNPGDGDAISGLQRELHTLKGGARMAGLGPIGDLSHVMESLFEAVVEDQVALDEDALGALEGGFDRLHGMLQTVRAREPLAVAKSAIARLESVLAGVSVDLDDDEFGISEVADQTESEPEPEVKAEAEEVEPVEAAPEELAEPEPVEVVSVEAEPEPEPEPVPVEEELSTDITANLLGDAVIPPPMRPAAEDVLERALGAQSDLTQFEEPRPAPETSAPTGPRPQQEIIRVRSELLDSLVNYAGEVSIYRSRLEQQVGSFRFNLIEFDQTVSRLREQLRKLELETETQILSRFQREGASQDGDFDPLEMDRFSQIQELSRALAESVSDLVSIQNLLDDLTRESETLLLQQSRVSSDLQEGLMRTRMVPFDSLVPRLRRILRQTSNELGKKAQLRVSGAQGEMDRTVLERITAPLEHMLRNALAHGLESPETRKKNGKDETGTINITVSREATEVVLQVADDGGGIDRDVVRAKAVERGMLHEGAELSDRDIYGFILETGFSTAQKVTKVSGRGVGMDVVNSEIKQLGGSLDIDSVPGRGTVFTVRLPFTLAVTHAIMVRVNEQTYAVPLSSVQGVVRLQRDEFIRRVRENDTIYQYAGDEFHIQELHTLLGQAGNGASDEDQVPILMIRSGDQRAAIRVDAVTGSREVVVKSVGPQVASVPGIFGATILGDGRVILILDLGPLVRRGAALNLVPETPTEPVDVPARRPLVMVVDDSITMRKVTSRVLERNDMEVVTAKDGVDAVAALQERVPDLMLLDIEMPRMDGYELATHMRNDGRLQKVPIIMITSRTGEKHRQRAKEIGVDRYLGKPYQEAELMDHVSELLNERLPS